MAKVRRQYNDEDKAKILAHAAEHGTTVAAGHFNMSRSIIDRWQKKVRPKGAWRKKKWTDAKVAAVMEYLKTHSNTDAMAHFKISSSQISLWRRGLRQGSYKRKANGAANGLDTLPEKDALMWLERWRQAYFDRLKAETPSAASVLAALRGGK